MELIFTCSKMWTFCIIKCKKKIKKIKISVTSATNRCCELNTMKVDRSRTSSKKKYNFVFNSFTYIFNFYSVHI